MTMNFVKTELGSDPIIVECYFAASPEAVFRAWTDPEIIMKWFGPTPGALLSVTTDLRVGGAWRFTMSDDGQTSMGFCGEYLAINPDKELILSWSKFVEGPSGNGKSTPMSRVEVTLSKNGSGTNVHIKHSAIADESTRIGFTGGWEHGIENLRALLERPGAEFKKC